MPQAPNSTLLDFATNLDVSSPTLIPDLRTKIPSFPADNILSKRSEFEARGTELWNLATRRNRAVAESEESSGEEKTKVALLRVFAFGMLDSAAKSRNSTTKRAATCVRMLKVAFKSMKACIEVGELEFAGKVAQRAAWWLDEGEAVLPEDLRMKLGGEYYVWRMALAWRQDKLDVAEHMYGKFWNMSKGDPECAEDLADILYELGKSLYEKKHYELAACWLERALDAIDDQDLDRLSDEAGELRLAIMQKLFKSLLVIKTPAAMEKARHFLAVIDHSYSDKLIASLLTLEFLSTETEPDALHYFEIVCKMIRTITLTRSNFKTIMHHIHKLKKLSAPLASKSLDELLTLRLARDAKDEWVERACMMRIWIITTVDNSDLARASVKEILDMIHKNYTKPFSAAAAHAAQTLLWSHIEKAYNEKQYDLAGTYCDLALHPLFQKCGELNHAKVARKWILCSINRGDEATAREVYFRLPESQRNIPETRHLMHKVAMRANDPDFAAECLEMVAKEAGKDPTRLYACVLDALQSDNKQHAFQAMKKVLESYDYKAPKGLHLPALLRCMIRLVKSKMKDVADDLARVNEAVSTMCTLFEAVVEHAKRSKASEEDFNAQELGWFSKNSYNVAIEYLEHVHPSLLIRLCRICGLLIEMLDRDTPPTEKTNLRLRHIFCEYLAMSATIALARSEDSIEQSLDHYIAVAKHGKSLRQIIAEQIEIDSLSDAMKVDLINKHTQSIKFELEAALRLNKWDELSALFDQCWKYEDVKHWDTLADLAFSIHAELCEKGPEAMNTYQKTILQFIERVINKTYRPNEPIIKLAKHLRCLFHLTLAKDDSTAAHCIEQVTTIADKCKASKHPYPPNELEWMAATAFNHAVSCFCVKDDGNCQFWAEKALMLAAHADDNGVLADQLRTHYAKLRWDEK